MKNVFKGEKYFIHSYKHDGSIHRAWDEAVALEVCDDYIVFGNERTKVTEKNGSVWKTREPAVMFFFKERWFNIIAQLKKDGLYFYCNVASPFIIEEGAIKYIDYDLDLRVFPSGRLKVLDEMEYAYHRNKMKYSEELDLCIKKGLEDVMSLFKSYPDFLEEKNIRNYYEIYKEEKKSKKS